MRIKPSRPENMNTKFDENMSKSTAQTDINTTRDVTNSLNSVPGPGNSFAPKSWFSQRKWGLSI